MAGGPRGELIGRRAELHRLQAALARAAAGSPRMVMVGGEAGVGKTRLLTEFCARADAAVLWGSCLPLGDRGLPFAPLVEAVRNLRDDQALDVGIPAPLARLVAQGEDEATVTRSQLFEGVLVLIEDLSRVANVVFVVEDLHWADSSTRDLLAFLAPNLRSRRFLLVGSYRSDELTGDSALRAALVELARHPHVERFELAPFDATEVAARLRQLTGAAPTAGVLERLMARTQGNAYFVEELVASDGLARSEIPSSLREVLLARLDEVAPDTRRTLGIAALGPGDIDESVLAEVCGLPAREVRAHLREAIARRLLVASGPAVRFRHALAQEALLDDLLPGERAEYHGAYAAALGRRIGTATNGRPAATAQLAHHLSEAGDVRAATRAWVTAATAAEAMSAFDEAHHYRTQVLSAWPRLDGPGALVGCDRVELLRVTAEDAFLAGDAAAAVGLAREAIALHDAARDPSTAGVLYERLSRYLRDTAERDAAHEAIEQALRLVPADPPTAARARVLGGHASALMLSGRLGRAHAVCGDAVAMARRVGAADVTCDALVTLGTLQCYLDDDSAGIALLEEALAMAGAAGDAHQQMRGLWNLYVCAAESGRLDEAARRARAALDTLPRIGHGHLLPELYRHLQSELVSLGRFDEAHLARVEALERFPARAAEAVSLDLEIATGAFDEARRLIAEAWRDDLSSDDEARIELTRHVADLATWEGDSDAARQALDESLALSAGTDRPIAAANTLATAMRCEADAAATARREGRWAAQAEAERRGERHVALMEGLQARPGPATGWKRVVAAMAALCGAEMSRLRNEPDPPAWQRAADAAAGLSMAYQAAYAELRRAEALVGARTDAAEAAGVIERVHRQATEWGARPLQHLVEGLAARANVATANVATADAPVGAPPLGLTPREVHVLGLVARGASNRQIAEELFISEKTASVHVSNIMRKLGVSKRAEAAALAHRRGLAGGDRAVR